jgi:hypothetical protein
MAMYFEKGKSSRQINEGGSKMLQQKNVTRKIVRTEHQEHKGVGTFGYAKK